MIALDQYYPSTVFSQIYHYLRKLAGLPALIFDIPWCSFARKISDSERQAITDTLSAGDILLTSDKLFPLWQYAVGVFGSPRYSHAAIYEGENHVIEATTFHPSGDGVARTAIHDFLSGRKNVCVIRPAYQSEYNKNAMFAWLMRQMGKPYDYAFNCDDDCAMYCAKLVAKAMRASGFTSVGAKRFLHRELYLPDTFIRSADMNVVYRKPEKLLTKLMHRLPQLIALSLWLAGITPLWFVCLVLVAAGWGQYKLKL